MKLASILFLLFCMSSCSSRYVAVVSPETKMEFGIMLEAPSKGMFFVENEKVGGRILSILILLILFIINMDLLLTDCL